MAQEAQWHFSYFSTSTQQLCWNQNGYLPKEHYERGKYQDSWTKTHIWYTVIYVWNHQLEPYVNCIRAAIHSFADPRGSVKWPLIGVCFTAACQDFREMMNTSPIITLLRQNWKRQEDLKDSGWLFNDPKKRHTIWRALRPSLTSSFILSWYIQHQESEVKETSLA